MTGLYDICSPDDIPDTQTRGFTVGDAAHQSEFFIVHRGDNFYGYLNHCPHTGVNLNWQPDRFLNSSGQLIQCSAHGAQFRIHDGYCIYGPCQGGSLTVVRFRLEDDRIKIQL